MIKSATASTLRTPVVGRFAPSPTGELHLGSLTTALASYLHIKSMQGRWLLRMEDTDYQRCDKQFSQQILIDLERLGLHYDGDVWYQSERVDIYNQYLNENLRHRCYGCECSRKQLNQYPIYPRYCIHKQLDMSKHKVRIQLPNYCIGFMDHLQGMQWNNPQQSLGDVVVRRANGIINYFLAVSVDDALQGVTHVMRGLDILSLTVAQIAITHYIGLPEVTAWYHLPLVHDKQGQKLSKQNLAMPIDTSTPTKCSQLLDQALTLLNQPKVEMDTPERMLNQAISQWNETPLRHQQVINSV